MLFSEADLAARRQVEAWCREAGIKHPQRRRRQRFRPLDRRGPLAAARGHRLAHRRHSQRRTLRRRSRRARRARPPFAICRRAGVRPRRSVDLIVFTAEEPTRFGLGCLGSRLLGGALDPAGGECGLADRDGRTFDDWRAGAGYTGHLADVYGCHPARIKAFVELHIEQGPILEQQGLDIGAVEKIAAPAALRLRLHGVGGHAGAVLMPERHDALLAGAEIALAVERAARGSGSPDTVGTTGVFRVAPGAINSVPSFAELEIDLRDTDLPKREAARAEIERAIAEVSERRGVRAEVETINADPPAACDPRVVDLILQKARDESAGSLRMISRAYHDTLFMARVCPVGMIFIPCRGGVSHRPDEFASPEAIRRGVSVLAGVLAELASAD